MTQSAGVIEPELSTDRRSVRTRSALVEALADEALSVGDLGRVTVTAVAERAGLTRRSFYTHFKDIPDLVAYAEHQELLELKALVKNLVSTDLDGLSDALQTLNPSPGSIELLEHIRNNGTLYLALLGEGGDVAFIEKIKVLVREVAAPRALDGIDSRAIGSFFDYYLTFVVSAECGVLVRWLSGGMRESNEVMARIMTALMFVRPGDLYGRQIDISLPLYGLALMQLTHQEEQHVS
ncbi:MAG: TetR/AcrR family transcriptional regulator C-terminal domain-containing protein [Atopobiaceae bacterium]|nr:TetR/AcrR family transcriptional regulator C-terminal domain-containing protein [Atopobiaceae bacterium]